MESAGGFGVEALKNMYVSPFDLPDSIRYALLALL
jgi:hypothetical protein